MGDSCYTSELAGNYTNVSKQWPLIFWAPRIGSVEGSFSTVQGIWCHRLPGSSACMDVALLTCVDQFLVGHGPVTVCGLGIVKEQSLELKIFVSKKKIRKL